MQRRTVWCGISSIFHHWLRSLSCVRYPILSYLLFVSSMPPKGDGNKVEEEDVKQHPFARAGCCWDSHRLLFHHLRILCQGLKMTETSTLAPLINQAGSVASGRSVSRQSTTSSFTEDWDLSQEDIKIQIPAISIYSHKLVQNETARKTVFSDADTAATERKLISDSAGRGPKNVLNKDNGSHRHIVGSEKDVADLVADLGRWVCASVCSTYATRLTHVYLCLDDLGQLLLFIVGT